MAMSEWRLGEQELLSVVRQWTAQPWKWEHLLECPAGERWSGLLHLDDSVDVWVLTWPVQTGTQLHDHGDSAGAFEVVSGELEEICVGRSRRRLRRRQLRSGARVSFPTGAVHDVRNAGASAIDRPAVSVHAYSPPLTSMTYYEQLAGHLVAVHSEPVVAPPLLRVAAGDRVLAGSAR
jgi:hypothetical protein